MIDEEIYLRCVCGNEIIRIGLYSLDDDGGDCRELAVNIYECKKRFSILYKLRYIWQIIKTGQPYGDQVLLGCEQFQQMKDFLNQFETGGSPAEGITMSPHFVIVVCPACGWTEKVVV